MPQQQERNVVSGTTRRDFMKVSAAIAGAAALAIPASGVFAQSSAEIKIGDTTVALSDESPEWGNYSPQSLGGATAIIY
jgi:anaerobic selenocysteine-containing dehydrogenase